MSRQASPAFVSKRDVAPLTVDEKWKILDVTLTGAHSEAVFSPFAGYADRADFVRVYRPHGDEIVVMMSRATWLRLLRTVEKASANG